MVTVYLFIGFITAILGAIPLGASNIAVINTTLKQNAKQAIKIAITAGFAEVILSYYALHCNITIKNFFNNNLWIQVVVVCLLFIFGSFLLFKKQPKNNKQRKRTPSKYATGFILGIINPPVLFYWIITYNILNNNDFMLSLQSSFSVLFLFFFGVYLGKLLTLYLYSRISIVIKNKVKNISLVVNKITGVLLILIGFAQAIKLYII